MPFARRWEIEAQTSWRLTIDVRKLSAFGQGDQIRLVDEHKRSAAFFELDTQGVDATKGRRRALPGPGELPSAQHTAPLTDRI